MANFAASFAVAIRRSPSRFKPTRRRRTFTSIPSASLHWRLSGPLLAYIRQTDNPLFSMSSSGTSLRRSCQGCVKVKRRCDLLFPECSRCLKKGVRCHYTNIPLSSQATNSGSDARITKPAHGWQPQPRHHTVIAINKTRGDEVAIAAKNPVKHHAPASDSSDDNNNENGYWIRPALDMAIRKQHSPYIINLLSKVVCQAPSSFAHGNSIFIHPFVYGKSLPRPVADILALCNLYENRDSDSENDNQLSHPKLRSLLQRQIVSLLHSAKKSTDFEELVACVQALTLAQCMQLSEGNIRGPGVEKSLDMLAALACKMWSMVPRELPSSMSPWHAWIFAETVRRTIVFSHLVIATFSFLTRGYACRTPFIDALPFDGRTYLWKARSEAEWTKLSSGPNLPMVSVIEFTDLLESGRTLCFSPFEGLIVATCRGLELPIHDISEVMLM